MTELSFRPKKVSVITKWLQLCVECLFLAATFWPPQKASYCVSRNLAASKNAKFKVGLCFQPVLEREQSKKESGD